MSSACVCHIENKWCFYCNMYAPLEEENRALIESNILNGNQVTKYENAMRLIQRKFPVEDVDVIPITVLYEIQKIIKDTLD